jgi:hypothetical protein
LATELKSATWGERAETDASQFHQARAGQGKERAAHSDASERVKIDEALADVDTAFRQLEFAIKLLSYCELDHVKPSDFDTDHLIFLEGEKLNFPSGKFSDIDAIVRAASIGVLLAFSASVLVLDKAFEVAGIRSDPEATGKDARLRTLVYMVRCAQAHGIAEPRWEVRGKYLRILAVDNAGTELSLDLPALHGEVFHIDQIGGYPNWYRVRDAACALIISQL